MSRLSSVTRIRCLWLIFSFAACTLYGCASPPDRPTGSSTQTNASESAIRAAQALLLSEETFYQALSERDARKMVDAALSRDNIQPSTTTSRPIRKAIAKTTREMLKQALLYAKDDAELTKHIEKEIKRHQQRPIPASFKVIGNGRKTVAQDDYVQTLDLEANSKVSVDLPHAGTNPSVGTIVYVEHKPKDYIVLSIVKQDGKSLCRERNPRGYLICRYKSLAEEQLRVIVSNQGLTATSVLLIKNH